MTIDSFHITEKHFKLSKNYGDPRGCPLYHAIRDMYPKFPLDKVLENSLVCENGWIYTFDISSWNGSVYKRYAKALQENTTITFTLIVPLVKPIIVEDDLKADESAPIKVGDMVKLKSGSPIMLVTHINSMSNTNILTIHYNPVTGKFDNNEFKPSLLVSAIA